LLTYRHAEGEEGTEPVPGLARALPKVSADGVTYTLKLRLGLRYSNGVPVRAGDFERAVNRVRALHSPLAPLYDGIRSIDADAGAGTIRVVLERPDSTFPDVLALPSSAPVPRGTPSKDLSGRPPPGVGAYRIATVAERSRMVLVRSREFRLPGIPPGYVDRLTLIRAGSPARQAEAVIAGSVDVMEETPPIDLLPEVRSKYKDRYREDSTVSTVALMWNLDVPPLDDPDVRQAIRQSLDEDKLARLYEGLLAPSCNFLPESVHGYRAIDHCPFGGRDEPPNLVDAKDRIDLALANGAAVSVRARRGVPPRVTNYVARTLRKIGLAARVGGGAGAAVRIERVAPFLPHPAAFLERFTRGTFDPQLNEAVADGSAAPPEGDESDDAWASADERVVTHAYAAPLGSERRPTFLSERIDAENCARVHPVFGIDLSSLCLK
jgi:peptide/nickel transport system substrate-binding protein